jgi:hypothetical protein
MKQPASKFPPSTCLTLPALALCLTPLIAVPAYAADTDSAKQTTPTTSARTATIDKDTNSLRAPEADEPSAAATQSATSRSAAGQSMLRSPNALRFQAQTIYGRDGTVTKRLDPARALRFSVVHRHADGSLHKDCLVGEEAVATHLSAAAPKQGANHE